MSLAMTDQHVTIVSHLCDESDTEIKCRIQMTRDAFIKLKEQFINTDLILNFKAWSKICYVWTMFLYEIVLDINNKHDE